MCFMEYMKADNGHWRSNRNTGSLIKLYGFDNERYKQ